MRKRRHTNWIRLPIGSAIVIATIAACSSQAPQPQDENLANATVVRDPVAPGALGNEAVNYPQGPVTPAEQADIHATDLSKPEQVAQRFADLLEQKKFAEAFSLVDGQAMGINEQKFESRFSSYKTIDAGVGKVGPSEGAAGSLYSTVQLTLSGNAKNGSPYVMTGPVTLRRVNDVPGSTAEQRRWHIVKMELTASPKAAER